MTLQRLYQTQRGSVPKNSPTAVYRICQSYVCDTCASVEGERCRTKNRTALVVPHLSRFLQASADRLITAVSKNADRADAMVIDAAKCVCGRAPFCVKGESGCLRVELKSTVSGESE